MDFGTCALSDALDEHGVEGVVDGLHYLAGDQDCRLGRAVVAEVVDGGSAAFEGLSELLDSVTDGDFLVLVWKTAAIVSTMGDLAATRVHSRGGVGLVSEGYVRDIDQIESSGLSVWARGATPRTGRGRVSVRKVGTATFASGITVRDGDTVVADRTGVVILPQDLAAQVMERARAIEQRDTSASGDVASAGSFSQVLEDRA